MLSMVFKTDPNCKSLSSMVKLWSSQQFLGLRLIEVDQRCQRKVPFSKAVIEYVIDYITTEKDRFRFFGNKHLIRRRFGIDQFTITADVSRKVLIYFTESVAGTPAIEHTDDVMTSLRISPKAKILKHRNAVELLTLRMLLSLVQVFFIFMQILGKLDKIIGWRPPSLGSPGSAAAVI